MTTRPRFVDLPDGNARGVFGADDQLGCLNLLTPERTAAAAALVRSGTVFSLNAPIFDWPDPNPPSSPRKTPDHEVFELVPNVVLDDALNHFYLQASSQWDGFLHVRDPASGQFYNGQHQPRIGVEVWAERGIAGRGVLLDVAAWATAAGEDWAWQRRRPVTAADLEACADAQGVAIGEGTILLIRLGWETGYRALDRDGRVAYASSGQHAPGLEASADMAARLWDWGVAAVAGDTIALEAKPYQDPMDKILHTLLLPRLGLPMGELWLLDALAQACAAEHRYEFFLTSAPLNVRGGVGTPANALAVM
jgi:kynurenine formamidase